MSPLRAAAFVMLLIAGLDGMIKFVDMFANGKLWAVMLILGCSLLLIDMIFDRRTILGRVLNNSLEWIAGKFRDWMAWTAAVSIGDGTTSKEEQPQEEPQQPEKQPAPQSPDSSTRDETAAQTAAVNGKESPVHAP